MSAELSPMSRKDLDQRYPGLESTFSQQLRILTQKFAPYSKKYSVPLIIPSLAMVEDQPLLATAVNLAETHGLKSEGLSYAHFSPEYRIIMLGAQGSINTMRSDRNKATLILAEEIVHSLSTFDSERGIRVGFLQIATRFDTSALLAPGQVYDLTNKGPFVDQFLELPTDQEHKPIDPHQYKLTEIVTGLLLHTLLPDLLGNSIKANYPYLVISHRSASESERPAAFEKNPKVADTAIEALVSGDVNLLAKHYRGDLLRRIQLPGTFIVSARQVPTKSMDDLFFY